MAPEIIGIICALCSALGWATGAILFKKILERASALGMTLVKCLLSLPLFLAALLIAGIEPIDFNMFILLSISGLLGISLGDAFFFKSLQYLSAHPLVVLGMLSQVFTIVLAVLFLGETPTLSSWMGIIMIIGGVAFVLYTRIADERTSYQMIGIFYGMLSALCMSVSVIVTKTCMISVSPVQATSIRMVCGVLGLLIWGLISGKLGHWLLPFRDFGLIKDTLWAVIAATFAGFLFFHFSLKYIDVSIANTLNSTEVLFLLPLSAIFLKERISTSTIIGSAIAVCGITIILVG